MSNKDKEVFDYIMENYDDLAWIDINLLINELSDMTKIFVYQFIIDNPTIKMHTRLRELLSEIEEKNKKKISKEYQYECCHFSCNSPAIKSHFISKKAVLAPLANEKNEMFFYSMDRDVNPFKCIFKRKNISSIATFPGYCEEHDRNIFKEIDQKFEFNQSCVKLNVIRMLKKEVFDLNLKVSLQEIKSEEWNKVYSDNIENKENLDLELLNESNCFFNSMNEKVRIIKLKIKKYEELYEKIFNEQKELAMLEFKLIKVKSVESCFSVILDTPIENNIDGNPHFFSYVNFNNEGYILIAKENNGKKYDSMLINEDGNLTIHFWKFLLTLKESIFFSEKFRSHIYEYQERILLTNYQFFEPTLSEALLFSQIYVE